MSRKPYTIYYIERDESDYEILTHPPKKYARTKREAIFKANKLHNDGHNATIWRKIPKSGKCPKGFAKDSRDNKCYMAIW